MKNTERTSKDLIPVFDGAREALVSFFRSKDRSPAAIRAAIVASSSIATYGRMYTAERADRATDFLVAREIAADKEELRRYISATQPDHPLVKKLGKS